MGGAACGTLAEGYSLTLQMNKPLHVAVEDKREHQLFDVSADESHQVGMHCCITNPVHLIIKKHGPPP